MSVFLLEFISFYLVSDFMFSVSQLCFCKRQLQKKKKKPSKQKQHPFLTHVGCWLTQLQEAPLSGEALLHMSSHTGTQTDGATNALWNLPLSWQRAEVQWKTFAISFKTLDIIYSHILLAKFKVNEVRVTQLPQGVEASYMAMSGDVGGNL